MSAETLNPLIAAPIFLFGAYVAYFVVPFVIAELVPLIVREVVPVVVNGIVGS